MFYNHEFAHIASLQPVLHLPHLCHKVLLLSFTVERSFSFKKVVHRYINIPFLSLSMLGNSKPGVSTLLENDRFTSCTFSSTAKSVGTRGKRFSRRVKTRSDKASARSSGGRSQQTRDAEQLRRKRWAPTKPAKPNSTQKATKGS